MYPQHKKEEEEEKEKKKDVMVYREDSIKV
jgi:hypothetical protein